MRYKMSGPENFCVAQTLAMALAQTGRGPACLRYAKTDFLHRQCGDDYRIVRVKAPEVERVIDFDTPDGYDCYVWEETPDNSF